MYVNSTVSACSPEDDDGDTAKNYQKTVEDAGSPASSTEDTVKELKDVGVEAAPFVPTVTAISSTPDFQWMVQPAIITSVSPSAGGQRQADDVQGSRRATPRAGGSGGRGRGRDAAKKGKAAEQLSPEEEEKKRIRRERNKMAAAKCRNRRRELTDTLQAETDQLEEERSALQTEIAGLLKEKERLEFVLAAHSPACQLPEELESMFQEPMEGPDAVPGGGAAEDPQLPEDGVAQGTLSPPDTDPSAAISGNWNILLCASAEIGGRDPEPALDVKGGGLLLLLDDLVSNTLEAGEGEEEEEEGGSPVETARSVPDIDLSGSLGVSDWETLYKSVSGDLEPPLGTPVVTSTPTPTCSSHLSVFTFACPELDPLAEGLEGHKGGGGRAESVDILNSPTLLVL